MQVPEKCPCGYLLKRNHLCEDYRVWVCEGPLRHNELEHFSEMNDEGWEWVRNYYARTKNASG
jgi:hypothetical protein